MERIQDILNSSTKHKKKVSLIVTLSKNDPKMVRELIQLLKNGTDVERVTSAEVLRRNSKENPKLIIKYTDVLIRYVDYEVPQVRSGVIESIGNLAEEYPDVAAKATSKLLDSIADENKAVRGCVAYALTEIAKNNPSSRKKLVPMFDEFIEKEEINEVRNVYIRALKVINK